MLDALLHVKLQISTFTDQLLVLDERLSLIIHFLCYIKVHLLPPYVRLTSL